MDSIQNKVYYCCVSKGNNILYVYSGGDQEVENVAALCLERSPPFHRWYFETVGKRTYGFFMEDGYVYFTIVDQGLGNLVVLRFLEHVRDEFRKLAKKGSRGFLPNMNSIHIQEKLVPVIRGLITSLESVSHGSSNWRDVTSSSFHVDLSPSPSNLNGKIEGASSTKAPLLGKSNKAEKKKVKDHVIAMRDVELEEHRKSTERGARIDSGNLDSVSQGGAGASVSLQKDSGSMRMRSGPQNIRKKWWRQVRIVLAIDAAVCIILFVIWLVICHGISCIR
ncbi:phytolongin Phyl1.1 [Cajanus cajan]|uniref:VAMP-like protein At1g33475 family n=1 Tax=Cajanus cajan TaxID=3821 RepID=A0A151SYL0_CAJCA|nr:phytolongin Phyl1.1 [Cajanus cajan]XP_020223071.1 phytolongin Phyl1.1 [Cajanus cajan]KYP59811.1 putative VAMP-like protein At1g33475 family [Cajanus cajan]